MTRADRLASSLIRPLLQTQLLPHRLHAFWHRRIIGPEIAAVFGEDCPAASWRQLLGLEAYGYRC